MNDRRVVVTGYGVISCVGNNVPDFWDALINGRCGIGAITRFDASSTGRGLRERSRGLISAAT